MKLNELALGPRAQKAKKRLGRGIGSGKGKTAGRGHKGQKSRSGVSIKGFEGGQMPFYRRLPKRGFTNIFKNQYDVINIGRLQKAIDAGDLDASKPINRDILVAAGLVRGRTSGVRVLAAGELSAKLNLEVVGASKAAIEAIEKTGGTIVLAASSQKETEAKTNKQTGRAKKDTVKSKPSSGITGD